MMKNLLSFKICLPFIFSLISVLLVFQCKNATEKSENKLSSYASLSDTVHYVGMEACKSCHFSIYTSYLETGMGKSFEAASRKKSAARFGSHEVVHDDYRNFSYYPFWKSDSLYVREFRLRGSDTVFLKEVQVNYIVGSGQHTNSHLMNTGGYVHQVPVTFYTQKGRWDLAPGFENGNNTRFGRKIGLECMTCHNGYPDFIPGSENKYKTIKNGIDCERCHGPGSVHVQQKSAGHLVDVSKEIDYSIVNPAKLPVDLQFDICQRCHIQGNAVLTENKSFFDFRPGMSLSSVMNVFMPLYRGGEQEHIMASHAERLKQSRCYIETRKRCDLDSKTKGSEALYPYKESITCVTCHNPHTSVLVTGSDHFNKTCGNCHRQGRDPLCSAPVKELDKALNNCVSCHMPRSGATDIPHVSVTDHRIQLPVLKRQIDEIRKFIGIACINNPAPPAITIAKAFIAYYEKFSMDISMLDSALNYLDQDPSINQQVRMQTLIHIHFLKNEFSKVILLVETAGNPLEWLNRKNLDNSDAWTNYRIGEAYTTLNQHSKALSYYKHAVELAPFQLDFQNKLGSSLQQNKESQAARNVFEFIIREDPGYYQAYSNLGFLYLTLYGDTGKASQLYNQSLAINPDYEGALMNKAGLFLYKGQTDEAVKVLRSVIKLYPGSLKAKELLGRIVSAG